MLQYNIPGETIMRTPSSATRTALIGLLASTALVASPAFAQAADDSDIPADIIVTATKRSENLQNVAVSIQALGEAKLDQQQVTGIDDFTKLLPSVSVQSLGPGQSQLYFRGISSGGDGLHIGPLPATGLYLDEIPVTTSAGSIETESMLPLPLRRTETAPPPETPVASTVSISS